MATVTATRAVTDVTINMTAPEARRLLRTLRRHYNVKGYCWDGPMMSQLGAVLNEPRA